MSPLTWQAPEFEHHPKSASWYWTTVTLAIILFIISVWQRNFTFSLLIVIGEILIIVMASREPKIISYSLSQEGFLVGTELLHPLGTIDALSLPGYSFDEFTTLVIHFRGKLQIPLYATIPSDTLPAVREFFSRNNIPEIDHEHTLTESFQRYIGF